MAEINVLVLDNGSDTVKAGYCIPERDPLLVTPTAVRLASGDAVPSDGGVLRPIRRGVVQDWEALESIYHHIFYEQLGWVMGEEGSVLVAEPLLTPKASREALAQLLFEQFNVAGFYVSEAPILSLYAAGKLTGTAVDIGAEKIDICPVYEGMMVSPGARRIELGGADLDLHTQQLLKASGVDVDLPEARAIKEQYASVCETSNDFEAASTSAGPGATHTLPDGKTITVPANTLACVGEAVFDPRSMTGQPAAGLTEEVLVSIKACINDYRRQMLESVLVCGGGSRMKGLDTRLLRELTAAAPATVRPTIVQSPEYMPENTLRYAPFIGGAILAKTVFPQNQHVTKYDYHESGPSIVSRRL